MFMDRQRSPYRVCTFDATVDRNDDRGASESCQCMSEHRDSNIHMKVAQWFFTLKVSQLQVQGSYIVKSQQQSHKLKAGPHVEPCRAVSLLAASKEEQSDRSIIGSVTARRPTLAIFSSMHPA